VVHQGNGYDNPYPPDKHLDQHFSSRSGLPLNAKAPDCFLRFDSDFETGNLDAAIQRGAAEFDLFMRVDSNTRGHTNWFYFTVANGEYLGKVQLNICNFRREKSLYQRVKIQFIQGLRPYVRSRTQ
jgi:cytosolic carboxypeptidase protein 2/3